MKHLCTALAFLAFFSMLHSGCKKTEPAPETPPPAMDPYAYSSDLQSSQDISFATLAISDIHMLGAHLCENNVFGNYFFLPASQSQTATIVRDMVNKMCSITYDSTRCRDGKTRNGAVFFNYNNAANAEYYRQFGFKAALTLSNYEVAGWRINQEGPAGITNQLISAAFNPTQTSLSWQISGKFKLTSIADTTRQIMWEGTLLKTLTNTIDTSVYKPSGTAAINWKLAKIEYEGSVSGNLSGKPFTYVTDAATPPKRDFNCSVLPAGTVNTVLHPFTSGGATFKILNYHPRSIDYGPNPPGCDNTGTISFKGEVHMVYFD